MKLERPLVVFDLETTGVNTKEDRIVEMGAIKLHPDGTTVERHAVFNPGIPIPKGASDVHGFTDDIVKDKPSFARLSLSIQMFLEGCDIATFNGNSFDVPMLYSEFARAGIDWDYKQHRFIDASVIFRRNERRTLEAALLFYCGEKLEGAHGAINDARATLDVLKAQLKRYEELPDSFDELHLYCNYDKQKADLDRCFEINEDGEYVLAFGKHKGELAKNCKSYLSWMLTADFAKDTKDIIKQILLKK